MKRVVRAALEARFKLDAIETTARDAAIDIARQAIDMGCEWIISFGGDGLVNEVVNGMVGSEAKLALIPGGTMNVLSRNLGIPTDPLEAVDRILSRAGREPTRSISLGSVDDRYFTFSCGAGFDAEAAAHVEDHRRSKRRFGEPYFYFAALGTFLKKYSTLRPFLTVEGDFGRYQAVSAIGVSGGTYAYLLGRPVRLGGDRPPDLLDLFMLERLEYSRILRYGWGALVNGEFGSHSSKVHDISTYTLSSDVPFAVHVDGEPLDWRTTATVSAKAGEIEILV
jgi:diacylglycerol kinase family enzyme